MIEAVHADLSISAQCRLLSISRSSFYYAPQPESDETLALMQAIDAAFLDMPWYGSRQMVRHLRRQGVNIGRRRVRRLMTKMGLSPVYQRPRTSDPHPQHRIYPYLLRDLVVERPNQVWCADITYIPMRRGFLYLVAIMDWATRKVLAWRLSNTMDVGFCVMALEEALARFGPPDIFNTVLIPTKPPPDSGMIAPRDSGMMSPPVSGPALAGFGCRCERSFRQAGGDDFTRRRLSPERSRRWALWTRRSRMASA
jgi:putative transposase